MLIWVLITSAMMQGPFMAFKNQDDCQEAQSNIPVLARCVPFASDIPDGKEQ